MTLADWSPTIARRLLCRVFGHRWVTPLLHIRRYYACNRCGEPGFWVEK